MPKIEFLNSTTGAQETTHGTDGRLSVSARVDERAYYNSRDQAECYSLNFNDDDVSAGDFIVYWQNARSDGKQLVVSEVDIGLENAGQVILHFVTGTASAGSALTPTNLNATSSNDAAPVGTTTARGNAALSGLTSSAEIVTTRVPAADSKVIDLKDRVRLGAGDAIALEIDVSGSGGDAEGTIWGFYE